jgi:hypothetical protein
MRDEMNAGFEIHRILDRLDDLSPWVFTGSLYLARWIIVVPVGFVLGYLRVPSSNMAFDASAFVLLFGFIVLAPLLETVLHCVVPYWLMTKMPAIPVGKRAWGFVAVSAMVMALLHIAAGPAAFLPSLITGGFLAYTYGHFMVHHARLAILHTWAFHAGINIVGWALIVASR